MKNHTIYILFVLLMAPFTAFGQAAGVNFAELNTPDESYADVEYSGKKKAGALVGYPFEPIIFPRGGYSKVTFWMVPEIFVVGNGTKMFARRDPGAIPNDILYEKVKLNYLGLFAPSGLRIRDVFGNKDFLLLPTILAEGVLWGKIEQSIGETKDAKFPKLSDRFEFAFGLEGGVYFDGGLSLTIGWMNSINSFKFSGVIDPNNNVVKSYDVENSAISIKLRTWLLDDGFEEE